MLKVNPSRIASILDLKTKEVEEVVYFVSYIVLDPGQSRHLKKAQVLDLGITNGSYKTREKLTRTLEDVRDGLEPDTFAFNRATKLIEQLASVNTTFSMDDAAGFITKHTGAKFGIGASAIEELLSGIDLGKEIVLIKEGLKERRGNTEQNKLMKRLENLDSLYNSGAKPE